MYNLLLYKEKFIENNILKNEILKKLQLVS